MLLKSRQSKEEPYNNISHMFHLITQISIHASQVLANIRVFAKTPTLVTAAPGKRIMTQIITEVSIIVSHIYMYVYAFLIV